VTLKTRLTTPKRPSRVPPGTRKEMQKTRRMRRVTSKTRSCGENNSPDACLLRWGAKKRHQRVTRNALVSRTKQFVVSRPHGITLRTSWRRLRVVKLPSRTISRATAEQRVRLPEVLFREVTLTGCRHVGLVPSGPAIWKHSGYIWIDMISRLVTTYASSSLGKPPNVAL